MVIVCLYYFRNVTFKIKYFKAPESRRRKINYLDSRRQHWKEVTIDSYLHTAVLIQENVSFLIFQILTHIIRNYVGF